MTEVDVTFVFDEILGRHMERLLGSRHGIGGLPLGVGTIACLTLLAEQLERGESGDPSSADENSIASLEGRLAELGLRDKEKAQSIIQEMQEKGYLVQDEQGRITGGRPAVSMAKLLERVFPKLPGETLVAYFIQTIDEVLSGRKTTEVAVAHFDQTLRIQGLPIKSPKTEKKPAAPEASKKKSAEHVFKETPGILKSTSGRFSTQEKQSGGVRIIGSAGDGFRYSLKDLQKNAPSPPAPLPSAPDQALEPEETAGLPPLSTQDQTQKGPEVEPVSTESTAEQKGVGWMEQVQPAAADPQSSTAPETKGESHPAGGQSPKADVDRSEPGQVAEAGAMQGEVEEEKTGPAGGENLPEPEGESPAPEALFAQESETSAPDREEVEHEETGDDLIEKQIAGFQNDLASLCPLCKEGKVKEEKTGTGKPYYKCSNKACNLVSWGRPHHVSCPVCSNPFLIEISSEGQKVTLQCPRATCKYQCSLSDQEGGNEKKAAQPSGQSAGSETAASKRKRRVVRRRLVRKKK